MEMNEFKEFCKEQPDKQNILDIFKGKWVCKVPEKSGLSTGGKVSAFEDERIRWLLDSYGQLEGASVLELGPFEAGHTYMLSKLGAGKIVSIEANVSSFLKCLCIKEVFAMNNVEFLLGDFKDFLVDCESKFDLILASGVLYHMPDPLGLLKQVCRVSDNLFLWTHYIDVDFLAGETNGDGRFGPLRKTSFENLEYEFSEQTYEYGVSDDQFCGGLEKGTKWLTQDSIFSALRHFGHREITVGLDEYNHGNGPSMCCFSQTAESSPANR
jgi:SAM-dependent methyltransferase